MEARLGAAMRALGDAGRGSPEQRLAYVIRACVGDGPWQWAARDPWGSWCLLGAGLPGAAPGSPAGARRAGDQLAALLEATAEPRRVSGLPPEDATAKALGSELLALPLASGESPSVLLLPAALVEALDASRRERLWLAASLAATTLIAECDRARLQASEERNRHAVREVAHLQRRLLPAEAVRIRGAEVAASLDAFDVAGGDYYDYMPLSHHFHDDPIGARLDHFGAMIADVSGHGAAAAVETAMLDALLRTYPGGPGGGPGGLLTHVNRYFFTREGRSHLITAFCTVCDPLEDRLHFACAGHPPALLKRGDGSRIETVEEAAGIPIGVLPDFVYEQGSCRFAPGDLLVLFTDGVIEARSPAGEEFGLERLLEVVEAAPSRAAATLEAVRAALGAHQAGAAPRDDRTLLVFRRLEA